MPRFLGKGENLNNSLTLRPWLTVRETAKTLSKELGSKIKESDIFRYAMDHKLMLSVNFAGAVSGTFGYYHTEWNDTHELGLTRFKPSDGPPCACGFEAGDLELTYSLWRVIVENIHRELLGLPVWSLPADEMGLAINSNESRYSERADKFYSCYGTVFMVENVSYDEKTGRLQSRSSNGKVTEGVFVVRTDEIQKFIERVKGTTPSPKPEVNNGKNAIPEQPEPEPAADKQTLTRPAIKNIFSKLNDEQWRGVFAREKSNGLHQANIGEKGAPLYRAHLLKDWLVKKGHYTPAGFQEAIEGSRSSTTGKPVMKPTLVTLMP